MKHLILVVFALFSTASNADELGVRFNNTVSSNGIFDLSFTSAGKLFQVKYDWEPFKDDKWQNFFFQGATGGYFSADFDTPASWVTEACAGASVDIGVAQIRLLQGVSVFVPNITGVIQFPTHFQVNFIDRSNGLSIGLERSHYSSASSSSGSGYDMTGFTLSLHL